MARFVWAVGGQTAELTLTEPMKFREGSLGRARTRFRSISLDQRTTVTELLTSTGADIVEGRVRFIGDPSLLSSMVEDAASGALLTYEHSNGLVFSDLLLEDAGVLTEISPDASRYGFGEWERTLRLRHVGDGANLLASPEDMNDTGAWTHDNNLNANFLPFVAPDLTRTASPVEDTSAATVDSVTQSVPDVAGTYLFSVFCRKNDSGFPELRAIVSESTNSRTPAVSFSPDTGAVSLQGTVGGVVLDFGVVDIGLASVGGGWLYVYLVVTHDATSGVPKWSFYPNRRDTLGGSIDASQTGTQTIWGAQIVKLDDAWTSGSALPAYVPNSKRVLWQLFPPVTT